MHEIIQHTIDWLTKLDAVITEMEPYLPDESQGYIHMDHSISYNFPYDAETIRTKEALFREHGFQLKYQHQFTDDGVLMYEFERDEISFTIYFRPTMEGASCKLNKIGEDIKKVPIFEVICMNAANAAAEIES